jgi:hypothetical protein
VTVELAIWDTPVAAATPLIVSLPCAYTVIALAPWFATCKIAPGLEGGRITDSPMEATVPTLLTIHWSRVAPA